MFIDHIRLCQANIALYAQENPPQVDGVVYSFEVVDGVYVITLRGSDSPLDWLRDFEAAPVLDPQLGYVHSGFLQGMRALFGALQKQLPSGAKVAITGHSLGGARARILAALFIVNGYDVYQLVTFGSPKPAFANLARIIQKGADVAAHGGAIAMVSEHISYRNRSDPVVTVPFNIADMEWEHTEPYKAVSAAPAAYDLQVLRDHHIGLYLQGVTALLSGPAAAPPGLPEPPDAAEPLRAPPQP